MSAHKKNLARSLARSLDGVAGIHWMRQSIEWVAEAIEPTVARMIEDEREACAALADEMGHHAATGFEIRDAIRERNNK
jgi:hypothetical protein